MRKALFYIFVFLNALAFGFFDLCKLILFLPYVPLLFCLSWETKVARYVINNLISIDQSLNALLGGDEDETISGRIGRHKDTNWLAGKVAKFLDMFERNHAKKSIEYDEGKDDLFV